MISLSSDRVIQTPPLQSFRPAVVTRSTEPCPRCNWQATAPSAAVAGLIAGACNRRGRRSNAYTDEGLLASSSSSSRDPKAYPSFRQRRVLVAQQVFDRFREDAVTAIYAAQEEAMRQGYGVVSTELVLYGILSDEQKGGGNRVAKAALVKNGVTKEALRRTLPGFIASNGSARSAKGSGSLPFSNSAKLLFDTANAESGKGEIGCEQLLLALSSSPLSESGGMRLLKSLRLDSSKLRTSVLEELALITGQPAEKQLASVGAAGDDKQMKLDEVATDLTQLAMDGLLDPVVGRDEEIQRIIQILLRKRKNNACLVGPPGVGKTAVVEGLAQLIAAGQVPSRLRGKHLYSLDLGLLVAGTKYRGEFEERLKNVISEVTSGEKDICLFIDEIHQLVGAGVAGPDSSMDAANMLKPSLARGELQVIGATTADEYTKHIEKDAALERRFQKVTCEEPTVAETVDILEGLRASYEAHHGVLITPEALTAAARLSQRYITDRFLPDKAVDLIDEASSMVQLRLEAQIEEANMRVDASVDMEKPLVTAADIARVLSKWSGVPVEGITEDESSRLMQLEELLRSRIIGQDEAISALARAVRRSRSGLSRSARVQRPVASLLFAGPTGVGKTELCKVLAQFYYLDPKALIRLDMSEYSEQHSVSRLLGPPPGYVGYDDPRSGQLTEAVRRRPYSVVVLDEIEKAHVEVLNLLLQVLEDGRLTDGKGRTVSFGNCIIIMTSNVGSKEILEQASKTTDYQMLRGSVQDQLQQSFRPEFLNRIDELLVFRALGSAELKQIVRLELQDAATRAVDAHAEAAAQRSGQRNPLELSWSAELENAILQSCITDASYGARPLRRAVQRSFEDPIAEFLVSDVLASGGAALVDIENSSMVVKYGASTLRPQFTVDLLS